MRIACLQFAPQLGDVNNNLSRADEILSNAAQDELERLDLLVLPELAFTGYNFQSLQHINPYLEGLGSGITSLWAKATALKYDCTVVVGYPEKVDPSAKWPASPEYYNSAVVVSGDGDIVVNYRKSFLYYTDETWALEGPEGFFHGNIPGLGNVALGISTDVNPYKLEAPWDDFEFAYHALDSDSNVIIVSMAWQTLQNPAQFLHNPHEPDLDTLVYWVQRLEPLVRSNDGDEIIFVFCNRTGTEYDATYTGTSAVLGVKLGEVFVYGVLGRGETGLLIVDTSQPPRMKLTDADEVAAESAANKLDIGLEFEDELTEPNWPLPGTSFEVGPSPVPGSTVQTAAVTEPLTHEPQVSRPNIEMYVHTSPRSATSPRLPWLAPPENEAGSPVHSKSPTRLQIPPIASRAHTDNYTSLNSAVTDIAVDTPGLPLSPAIVRRPPRPKLTIPSSASRYQSKPSPYPWYYGDNSSTLFTGGACMTPITPFDDDGWTGTPIDPKPGGWFWRHGPTLSALKESVQEEEEEKEQRVAKPKPGNDKPELQEEGYSLGVEVKEETTECSERSEDSKLQDRVGEYSVATKEVTLASGTEAPDELRLRPDSTSTSENTQPAPGDGRTLLSSSDNLPRIDDTKGHNSVTSKNPQPAAADASSQTQCLKTNMDENGETVVYTHAYRRLLTPRPASWAGPIYNTTRSFASTSKTLHVKQPVQHSAQNSGASQQQYASRFEPDNTMEEEDLFIFDSPSTALHTTASTMTPTSNVPTSSEPSLTTSSSLSTTDDSPHDKGTSALQRVQGLFFRKEDGQHELGHDCEDDDGDSGYGHERSSDDGYKTERSGFEPQVYLRS